MGIIANPEPEKLFSKMREKKFEPMIIKKAEYERSTAEGGSSGEEEDITPERRAELDRLAEEKRIEQERRAKVNAEREEALRKQRAEEALVRAEEKAVREAKKKVE